eukprot:529016-Amphidinium_carterae.1
MSSATAIERAGTSLRKAGSSLKRTGEPLDDSQRTLEGWWAVCLSDSKLEQLVLDDVRDKISTTITHHPHYP